MAKVSDTTKSDPEWNRAYELSNKMGKSTYPATWTLNFIHEWDKATKIFKEGV